MLLTHSHVDHIRDLPTLGLATLDRSGPIEVYALPETLEAVHNHLLNGCIFPDLTAQLGDSPAKYRFRPIRPGVAFRTLGYQVTPIPMPHTAPCVGFIVRSDAGGCIGYTGDTRGGLLPFFRDQPRLQWLFVDVSFPNRLDQLARLTGHLTPGALRKEMLTALAAGMPLPRMVAVHLSAEHEDELTHELGEVAAELGVEVGPGCEDMQVTV
jgi:cAMP phosphodiesterase